MTMDSPYQPGYWYMPHRTKQEYDKAFQEALEWARSEGKDEDHTTAARIYHVKEATLRQSLNRLKKRKRNDQGVFNTHGGNNRVLNDAQEEAIRQYCYEQWEAGMGATHNMVFAAIVWLREAQNQKAPSRRWFQGWLKKNTTLHTIKTKPIASVRLESHTEEGIKIWFQKLHDTCKKYKITSSRRVLNMDESGNRIGCPTGEHIVVPIDVTQHYTASPENRKSITIIETIYADGRALPPFIITPGKKVMDNWVAQKELRGNEYITCSPTGYTNNKIALEYLDHFILHTKAGENEPWILLLLDGHESHRSLDFKAKAAEHHIKLFWFPSHLTHALQPLDVGVFRPWKHWHTIAVQNAIRSLDFDYSITSFMRDLTWIREKTMQRHTIINAFRTSGMWPTSVKAGLQKIREYSKKKKSKEEIECEAELGLPLNPPTRAEELWQTTSTIREFGERDPTQLSSPSRAKFQRTMKAADIALQKAHLLTIEHTSLQQKLASEKKRKNTSRRSVHAGGPGESIESLNAKIQARNEKESQEALLRASSKLSRAINGFKNKLQKQGIQARKDEKARRIRVYEMKMQGIEVTEADLTPIREPDKTPSAFEALMCSSEGYPHLVTAIQQLQQGNALMSREIEREEEEEESEGIVVVLSDTQVTGTDKVIENIPSSPPERAESIVESIAGSVDSLSMQADYVRF